MVVVVNVMLEPEEPLEVELDVFHDTVVVQGVRVVVMVAFLLEVVELMLRFTVVEFRVMFQGRMVLRVGTVVVVVSLRIGREVA